MEQYRELSLEQYRELSLEQYIYINLYNLDLSLHHLYVDKIGLRNILHFKLHALVLYNIPIHELCIHITMPHWGGMRVFSCGEGNKRIG